MSAAPRAPIGIRGHHGRGGRGGRVSTRPCYWSFLARSGCGCAFTLRAPRCSARASGNEAFSPLSRVNGVMDLLKPICVAPAGALSSFEYFPTPAASLATLARLRVG